VLREELFALVRGENEAAARAAADPALLTGAGWSMKA